MFSEAPFDVDGDAIASLSRSAQKTHIRGANSSSAPTPQGHQVSRKVACKNAEFKERGSARSIGINETPTQNAGLGGVIVQPETGSRLWPRLR